jgi:hypothetical protein
MATMEDQVTSTISTRALSMLRCFVSGMDKVVYELAQQFAEQRADSSHTGPIDIEAPDVLRAAEYLAERIKVLVAEGNAPAGMNDQIDSMVRCCRNNAS